MFGLVFAEVHEHGGFVFRQVVQTRVENDVGPILDDPSDALRFLVDGAFNLLGFLSAMLK